MSPSPTPSHKIKKELEDNVPIPEMMRINKGSSESQMKAAMSACIATEVKNGREQQQAIAMCSEMMRARIGGSPAAPGEPAAGEPAAPPAGGGI